MFEFTPFALPHIGGALILLSLGMYSIRYRLVPMAVPFACLVLSAALWCVFYSLELCTVLPALKISWAKARFIGLAPLSTLWLAVGAHLSGELRWLRGRVWLALAAIPATVIALSLTSAWHSVFRFDYAVLSNTSFSVVTYRNGPLFWVYALYSYGVSALTAALLFRALRRRNAIRQRQALLVTAGIALFIAIDILFQMGITPIRQYTLTPAALAISGILLGLAVFQYRILDLSPLARSMVMDGIADMILIVDEDGKLTEFNRSAGIAFGLDARRSAGLALTSVHPFFTATDSGIDRFCTPVSAVLELGGAPCQFEIGAKPILWAGKYEVGVLWQLHDVTESKRLEAELLQKNRDLEATVKENEALQIQLKEQAIHDPLTGLYNRRYLDEMIAHDLSLAIRTGIPVAIAMVDIDHFKQVNDQFGHQAGDQVLKELAILLTGGTRKSDMVCRYGGEEFLIALYGSTVEQAGTQLDELRRKFAQLVTACGELRITATLSAGIAGCPRHSDSAETLISRADAALYEAKRMGRNQVRTAAD